MPSSIWRPDSGNRLRHFALWAGFLGPALVWLVLLEANYTLAYNACDEKTEWFLGALIVLSIALGAASGIAAWKMGPPADTEERSEPWSLKTREVRARWMSVAAVAGTAWFLLVMLSMAAPIIAFRPCD